MQTETPLTGYGWVTDLSPVCEWCGWTPKTAYPTLRRAQEGMQGHEAADKYGCKTARTELLPQRHAPAQRTPDQERRQRAAAVRAQRHQRRPQQRRY